MRKVQAMRFGSDRALNFICPLQTPCAIRRYREWQGGSSDQECIRQRACIVSSGGTAFVGLYLGSTSLLAQLPRILHLTVHILVQMISIAPASCITSFSVNL
ncbi:hypothetical protein BDZ97DRAFT_1788859 [Flammula alnicola]|nr:hypothetical protein BDZ97DRAFT_1788859 [Flammula alnicola]